MKQLTPEEFLQQEYGITFTKSGDEFHNEIANDWLNSMKAYTKHFIENAVSNNNLKDRFTPTEYNAIKEYQNELLNKLK